MREPVVRGGSVTTLAGVLLASGLERDFLLALVPLPEWGAALSLAGRVVPKRAFCRLMGHPCLVGSLLLGCLLWGSLIFLSFDVQDLTSTFEKLFPLNKCQRVQTTRAVGFQKEGSPDPTLRPVVIGNGVAFAETIFMVG